MATFEELQRVIKDLPDADFRVFTSSEKPSSEAEVASFEQRIGRALPAELRKLYRTWGVLVVEVVDTLWPRPKELEVLPSWRFSYGFRVLGIGAEIPPEMTEQQLVPFSGRIGVRWLSVLTKDAVGTFQPGEELETGDGDAIDCILHEIRELKDGIGRLRSEQMAADGLMEIGRQADWKGPSASNAVNGLKKRPPAELAPHLSELVDRLLPGRSLAMGCLDIIAVAGLDAFRPVADRVYAHPTEEQWVIELLRKLGDDSPKAIARYLEALASSDDDVYEAALDAAKAIAKSPAAKQLVPALHARLAGELEGKAKARTVAILGHLGEAFAPLVVGLIGELDGSDFGALLRALKGLPVAGTELEPKLVAHYRQIDPKDRNALEAIEGLLGVGIEDRETMEPTVRDHFLPRGGRWAGRAQAVLDRWK